MGNFCGANHHVDQAVRINPYDVGMAVAEQATKVANQAKGNYEAFKDGIQRSGGTLVIPGAIFGSEKDIPLKQGVADDETLMHAALLCATGLEFRYAVQREVWDRIRSNVRLQLMNLPVASRGSAEISARTSSNQLSDARIDNMIKVMASKIDAGQGIVDVKMELEDGERAEHTMITEKRNNLQESSTPTPPTTIARKEISEHPSTRPDLTSHVETITNSRLSTPSAAPTTNESIQIPSMFPQPPLDVQAA